MTSPLRLIRRCAPVTRQGFEETTLSAIASRIAQTHGLKLVGKIEPLTIDRVTQYGETDVGFLKRLASEYGYAVKVTTKELIFSHLPTLRCLAPVQKIDRKDVSHFTFKDTINRIYKNATVQHQNSKKKELVILHSQQPAKTVCPWSRHQCRHAKTEQSGYGRYGAAQAKPTLHSTATTNISKPERYNDGLPELTAGNKIELTDFGVLSGQWLIDKSTHSFVRSGYTTDN